MFNLLKNWWYKHCLKFKYFNNVEPHRGIQHNWFMLFEYDYHGGIKLISYSHKDVFIYFIKYREMKNFNNIAPEFNINPKYMFAKLREFGGKKVGNGMIFENREDAQKAIDLIESFIVMEIITLGEEHGTSR